MAITGTKVASGWEKVGDNDFTVTFTASTAVGDYLIFTGAWDNDGGAGPSGSISDPKGNTWTVQTYISSGNTSGAGVATAIIYCKNVVTPHIAGDTLNAHVNSPSAASAGQVFAFQGLNNTLAPLHKGGQGDLSSVSPSIPISSSAAGNLLVAVVGHEANTPAGGDSNTTNGNWSALVHETTTGGGSASNVSTGLQYKVLTGTTFFSYVPTISSEWAIEVIELRAAPTAVTVTAELYENGVFKASLGTLNVDQAGVFDIPWDAASLSSISGADVELRLTAPAGFDVDAIEWNALFENTTPVPAIAPVASVDTTTAFPAVTIIRSTTVVATVIATSSAVGAPALSASTTTSPTVITTVTTVVSPSIVRTATALPVVVATAAGLAAPTIRDNEVVAVVSISTSTAVGGVQLAAGTTLQAGSVATATTMSAPTVLTIAAVTHIRRVVHLMYIEDDESVLL